MLLQRNGLNYAMTRSASTVSVSPLRPTKQLNLYASKTANNA
jgi:hypothetical protein